jgi:acetate kinase
MNDQVQKEEREIPDHNTAIKILFDWVKKDAPEENLAAVGHRIVHGGIKLREPVVVDSELIKELSKLVPLAPEHIPHELKAVKFLHHRFPQLKQVACFDTGFHRHMSQTSQMYPIPLQLWTEGIRRYGFHGLSYEYIMQELRKEKDMAHSQERIVIAHLGNGASMAAVRNGRGIDTTMGFTPAGGLMMGNRSGDLDPGVIIYLQKARGYSAEMINKLVNEKSGLAGVSRVSSSMKDVLQVENEREEASRAVDLYCYQARKFLGALIAVLGGLDTLIFTAGIGENSPEIRKRICQKMEYLGLKLDPEKNKKNQSVISDFESRVSVRIMRTNEELMIARHTRRIIQRKRGDKSD